MSFQWGGMLILPHHAGQCHCSHWVFLGKWKNKSINYCLILILNSNSYSGINIIHYSIFSGTVMKNNELVTASCSFSTARQMPSVFRAMQPSSQNADPWRLTSALQSFSWMSSYFKSGRRGTPRTDNLWNHPPSSREKKILQQKRISELSITKYLQDINASLSYSTHLGALKHHSISGRWYYVLFTHDKTDSVESLKISKLLRGRAGFEPRRAFLLLFYHNESKTLGAAKTPSSPGCQRMARTSPRSNSPHLTGGAFVDLGVRASPQELHRNPPKLRDHCNGSQETMNAGRTPWLPGHRTPPSAAAPPDPCCPLAAKRPGAPYAPPTGRAASSLGGGFHSVALTPPLPLPGPESKRKEAPAPQHPQLLGSALSRSYTETPAGGVVWGQKIPPFAIRFEKM